MRPGAPAPQQLRVTLLLANPGPDGLVRLVVWPMEELVMELELAADAVAAAQRAPQEDAVVVLTETALATEACGQATDLDATTPSHRPTSRGALDPRGVCSRAPLHPPTRFASGLGVRRYLQRRDPNILPLPYRR